MKKDYIIKNAAIWTADRSMPWAECVAVKDGRIDYVGAYDENKLPVSREIVDAGGRMIMPAILDSHIHVVTTAKTMWCFLLEQREYESIEEIMEIVKQYAEQHPKEEVPYIYAYSCPTDLMEVDHADRYFMDRYVSDRPVLLCDANYHRCLVNSMMLELMEIDENVPYDPSTSCNYERFDNNVPNGLIEERAHEFHHDIDKMFEKLDWYPPTEVEPETIAPLLDKLTDYGICGVLEGYTDSEDVFIGLKKLQEQGRLNHYYHAMPLMNDIDALEETIRTAKEWKEKYEDDQIHIDTIKYFLDGTNELGTGAVIEPFVNDPEDFGILNMTEEDLAVVFRRLNRAKLNIQIHLVGDRAFRTALNAVERAQKSEKECGREFTIRVTLLHCELVHPDDRRRAADLGVYINFTPVFAGGVFGDAAKQYLGEKRFNSMYAFREIIDSGAVVNFASDIVDEEGLPLANPFLGIEVGHTRSLDDGVTVRESKDECMTREELLYGYTINNALGMGIADKAGSLEVGKMANLCILSDNVFDVDKYKIKDITPEIVIFEGKLVKGEF